MSKTCEKIFVKFLMSPAKMVEILNMKDLKILYKEGAIIVKTRDTEEEAAS